MIFHRSLLFCAWMERNKLIGLFSLGLNFFLYDTRTLLYIRITPESSVFVSSISCKQMDIRDCIRCTSL